MKTHFSNVFGAQYCSEDRLVPECWKARIVCIQEERSSIYTSPNAMGLSNRILF